MEETNARNVTLLPEKIDLVVCDASFISLKTLLPVFLGWLMPSSSIITLIKPQFEAGRVDVARGKGVVRDPEIHQRVIWDITGYARDLGLTVRGLVRSPLLGPKGNTEFLAWFDRSGQEIDLESAIKQLFAIDID